MRPTPFLNNSLNYLRSLGDVSKVSSPSHAGYYDYKNQHLESN